MLNMHSHLLINLIFDFGQQNLGGFPLDQITSTITSVELMFQFPYVNLWSLSLNGGSRAITLVPYKIKFHQHHSQESNNAMVKCEYAKKHLCRIMESI